jgi:hypothetical protein
VIIVFAGSAPLPHVHRQLVEAADGDQRRQCDRAPRAAIEPGPGPDLAPGIAGDQVLEVGGEVAGVLDRFVDMLIAEHLAAHLHAALVLIVRHLRPPCRGVRRAPR